MEQVSINIEAVTAAAPASTTPVAPEVEVVEPPISSPEAVAAHVVEEVVLPPLAEDPLTDKELIEKNAVEAASTSSKIEGSHIMTMTEKYWPDLLKVLTLCSKDMSAESSVLSIKKGIITVSKQNNAILTADISSIFGTADWDILSPQKSLRLLSMLSKGDSITLMNDDEINQYIVFQQNGDKIGRTLRLPKIDDNAQLLQTEAIDKDAPNVKLMQTYEIAPADVADLSKAMEIAKTIDSTKAITYVELVEGTFELISLSISDILTIEINENSNNFPTRIIKTDDLFSVSNPDADSNVVLKIYDNLVGVQKTQMASDVLFDSVTNIASTSIKLSTHGVLKEDTLDFS